MKASGALVSMTLEARLGALGTHRDGQGMTVVGCIDAQLGHTIILSESLCIRSLSDYWNSAGWRAIRVGHEHLWAESGREWSGSVVRVTGGRSQD